MIQANQQQVSSGVQGAPPPKQASKGDPFLFALGTFLPMAFGLPPMPQVGTMLGGYGGSGGGMGDLIGLFNTFGQSQQPSTPRGARQPNEPWDENWSGMAPETGNNLMLSPGNLPNPFQSSMIFDPGFYKGLYQGGW